jgi:hypothetical protein
MRPLRQHRRVFGLAAALLLSVSLLAFLVVRGPVSRPPPATDPAALLQYQLKEARQVAVRYPTLAKATAAGYTQAAPYAPGIGSHYMKYSLIYLDFNVKAPAMLLFNGDDPSSKIVGLAYYVYHSHGPPPDTFAGPYAQWHQHQHVCVGPSGAHLDGDSLECKHRGQNAWMLHLWVVDGYQAPQAVFSNNCSILQ